MKQNFLKGVNFGGWLLLEKWMTPALFSGTKAVDEYTFMQEPEARSMLDEHRRTFISESDFIWLTDHGINAVRLPVGYWVLKSDGPYIEASRYLDWAMDMANKYQLKMIIDVHGLPGSQNGRDHSGRIGRSMWYRRRLHREHSALALMAIARRYKNHPSFWGIQIINEPKLGLVQWHLKRYYRRMYRLLTKILDSSTAIIISDAFTPRLISGSVNSSSHPVVLDIHSYHMSTLFSQYRSVDWFFQKLARRKKLFQRLNHRQSVIIGEWSGVMRAETTKKLPKAQHDKLFVEYVKLQQDVYSVASGWFYWNYKTEKPGRWNFKSQVESGLISLSSPKGKLP